MDRSLTGGSEWRKILLFSLPIMAGQLLQQLYNTVDGIVVGNFISSDALAAVGSCATLTMVFIALALGMSNGSGIVVAQLFGARKTDELRRTASTALIMLFALGVFFSVLGFFSADFIMDEILRISEPEINGPAAVYFRIYSLGLLFQFIYNAAAAILRSVGDSRATLYFLLVSTVINMVLDLVFVYVFSWGVAGAAWATVIAQAACALVSLAYMSRRYDYLRFTPRQLAFDGEKFALCLKMGIPTSMQQLVISCGNLLLQRLVNSFGPVTMSAYTVGVRFDHYMGVPVMGFCSGISAFAGQNIGAGKPERVKRGLRQTIIMDLIFVAVLSVLIYALAEPLSRLFGVDGAILDQSVEFLRFMALAFPVFAFYLPINGAMQGSGDPRGALLSSMSALVAKVAGAYGMVYLLDMGYASCWRCNAIGWTAALIVASLRFASGRWRRGSIVHETEE